MVSDSSILVSVGVGCAEGGDREAGASYGRVQGTSTGTVMKRTSTRIVRDVGDALLRADWAHASDGATASDRPAKL